MYSSCSSSLFSLFFLDFYDLYELTFVGFLLLSKNSFFMLSRFSLTAIDFQVILNVALGLIDMHSAAASMWMVTKFSSS